MPRPRNRACLQDGLKLDLKYLLRHRFIRPGSNTPARDMAWISNHWGERARATISADMMQEPGLLQIRLGNLNQRIFLTSRPRHFGGKQWYFVCPITNCLATVLWMPPGATRFGSRHVWGQRRVAYRSQFNDRVSRAHAGKDRIRNRLIAGNDPDKWDFPPKPKWMRWRTYDRHAANFDRYEGNLMQGCEALIAKLRNIL